MKYLLDTHAALWFVNEHEKLSPKAKEILLDNKNLFYLSIASAWEIAIKVSIGKMTDFNGGVKAFLQKINETPINIISVTSQQIEIVEELPFIHNDPFDRLLIATVKSGNMIMLTADSNIHKYDIRYEW